MSAVANSAFAKTGCEHALTSREQRDGREGGWTMYSLELMVHTVDIADDDKPPAVLI